MESIIASVIASFLGLVGVIITNIAGNKKIENSLMISQAVTDTKIDELRRHVEKHNNVVERMYALEKKVDVIEEKVSVANHRIADIEAKVG